MVKKGFDAFYKVWNDTMVPRLISAPKWFKTSKDLKVEDIVYFQKRESEFAAEWTVGQIDSIEKGKDGIVREGTIQFHNISER